MYKRTSCPDTKPNYESASGPDTKPIYEKAISRLARSLCGVLAAGLLTLASAAFCRAQTLLGEITVGSYPVAVAVNPATNKIYVVNQDSNTVTVIDGTTNSTATVRVGTTPTAVAINAVTNKVYVANAGGTVTVINGATNQTSTITAGLYPAAIAVNSVSNKIYVANRDSDTVTVINGANNQASTVTVGHTPYGIAVNSTTNKIYVSDTGSADVAIIDGPSNSVTTVSVGAKPRAVAVNEITNKIYVANFLSNDVSIIDGATRIVTSIAVGVSPTALAVDPVRNQILTANYGDHTATIVDGVTLTTSTVTMSSAPLAVDVDAVTAKVYFVNAGFHGELTMLDEASGATTEVPAGAYPVELAINPVTNRIYVANSFGNTVSVVAGGNAGPLQFVPLTPCRVADTREQHGPFGGPYLAGGTTRSFALPQSPCNIPSDAAAYSLNVSVVPRGPTLDYLTVWPTGEPQPYVATLNSPDGRVKANAAIVPAGAAQAVSVFATHSTDVILDINGYFRPASAETLQFFSLPPCRVFDTRSANGDLGGPYLSKKQERDFPILASNCQIPANAVAYSMNFAVVPVGGKALGYLTVWPAGNPRPVVSTLNNPTATVVANAAIVPAGANGAIAVYPDGDTQLIGDINGYFAEPAPGGLSLYPLAPCRAFDTRITGGAFSGQRNPPVPIASSPCGIPAEAKQYVFNAAVVPVGALGYLTLWPDGYARPNVSTLNATDGKTASNMAIVGNKDGLIDAYAYGTTQLILDISSYFAP